MASSTPSTSFFKTLRDGALLPTRNRSLFMAVFALTVAYTLLRRLVHKVLRDVAKDTWRLFWPGGAQRLLDITVGNAVWIISLFAAVATYAGETCSFGALLG
nr:unnamed protein product [Digitaria exilis]